MKKLFAILFILVLLLTSCGSKGKDQEKEDQADQPTKEITEQEDVDSDEESEDDTEEEAFTSAEGMIFDGRKGKVTLQQELERDGIRISFDYLLFDDEKGLFDPPPAGCIFMYPVLTLKNERNNDLDISFTSRSSCIATVDGEEYSRSMDALYSYSGKKLPTLDTDIANGKSEQVYTGMIIPEDWKEISFVVKQSFDNEYAPVDMVFEIKRDSGTAKAVQVLEAKYKSVFKAAPRLSPENYLNIDEIEEITGLHNVGEIKPAVEDRMSQVDYILHADPEGSPDSLKRVELRFDLFYAKDELTRENRFASGSQDIFDGGRKAQTFVEDIPNLGDDAYWYTSNYGGYPALCVLVNDETYGPFVIALAINENGDKQVLLPLAERAVSNLKKLNEN